MKKDEKASDSISSLLGFLLDSVDNHTIKVKKGSPQWERIPNTLHGFKIIKNDRLVEVSPSYIKLSESVSSPKYIMFDINILTLEQVETLKTLCHNIYANIYREQFDDVLGEFLPKKNKANAK